MLKRLVLALTALIAAIVAFGVALLSPVDYRNPRTVEFYVAPGQSLNEVAADLHRIGLIRDPKAFSLWGRLRGTSRSLRAGPYQASTGEWAWEVLDRLVEGAMRDTLFTVPEGLWLTEVSEIVGGVVEGGAAAFLAAATDSLLAESLGVPHDTCEGYLFPSTYRVAPGSPARSVVRHMVDTFRRAWERELSAKADSLGMEMKDVVILASIVEAEALVDRERPRIAAVYLNRLERGQLLQADPTVLYGIGERKTRTLYDDLEHPSPYNTYLRSGLPPGPIGNPGLASLRAVLWPEPGCDDLYFVARGDGTHLFGKTYQEHLRNRRQVREERRRAATP